MESDTQFAALWESAYQKYQETAKVDTKGPQFPKPLSSEELFSLLDEEEKYFRSFREKKRAFFKTIQAVPIPLEVMGDNIGTCCGFPSCAYYHGGRPLSHSWRPRREWCI